MSPKTLPSSLSDRSIYLRSLLDPPVLQPHPPLGLRPGGLHSLQSSPCEVERDPLRPVKPATFSVTLAPAADAATTASDDRGLSSKLRDHKLNESVGD